jgi:hypothetical protein
MKTTIKLLILFFFCPLTLIGQETTETDLTSIQEEGWNKRISFFVGAGTSVISNTFYELPLIDKTNNKLL